MIIKLYTAKDYNIKALGRYENAMRKHKEESKKIGHSYGKPYAEMYTYNKRNGDTRDYGYVCEWNKNKGTSSKWFSHKWKMNTFVNELCKLDDNNNKSIFWRNK